MQGEPLRRQRAHFFTGDHYGEVRLACTVFVDPQGYVRYEGAPQLIDIIRDHVEATILEAPFWTDGQEETLGVPDTAATTEPQHLVGLKKIPKPLSNCNSKTLKSILPELISANVFDRCINWEKDTPPPFWPENVAFANSKQ